VVLTVPLAEVAAHLKASSPALAQENAWVREGVTSPAISTIAAVNSRYWPPRVRWSRKRGCRIASRARSQVTDLRRTHLEEIPSQLEGSRQSAPQALASAFGRIRKPTVWPTCSARIPSERQPWRRRDSVCRHAGRDAAKRGSRERLAGKRRDLQHRWEALVAPLRRSDLPPPPFGMVVSSPATGRATRDLESLRAERGAVDTDITEPATFWIRAAGR